MSKAMSDYPESEPLPLPEPFDRDAFLAAEHQKLLAMIPRLVQRQDSLTDQVSDLIAVANKLGMYDAADWVTRRFWPERYRR